MNTQKKGNFLAIIVMILLFGMISFVTNLASPMGDVLKNQVLDLSCAVGVAEQTTAQVVVAICLGSQVQVLDGEVLTVEDHAQAEGHRRNQQKHRTNEPKPGPVFFLSRILSHRDGLKELWRKFRKELANCIILAWSPNVG